jgi:hypothetical protein
MVMDAPKPGATVVIRCEEPGIGWQGEATVVLDAPWNTFRFQMEKPKP